MFNEICINATNIYIYIYIYIWFVKNSLEVTFLTSQDHLLSTIEWFEILLTVIILFDITIFV